MNIPCDDPWDYTLHDFYIITKFWMKHPPIHLVAASMVKSNSDDGSDGDDQNTNRPAKRISNKNKEMMYKHTLHEVEQTASIFKGGKPDQRQADRLAGMYDIMDQLNEGKTVGQIAREKQAANNRLKEMKHGKGK